MASNRETAVTDVYINGEQAEKALERLKKDADRVTKALEKAMRAGDSKESQKLKRELRGIQKEMKDLQRATFSTDKVLKNLSKATLNDLYHAKRRISGELRNMTRNTKEYRQTARQLRAVEGEIGKVRKEMGRTRKMAINLKSALSFLGIAGLITGVVTAIGRVIKSLPGLSMQMEGDARKAAVVFGDSLGYVEQQAADLATKIGVTNREFVAMAANTADLLIPLDFSREMAAEMSTELQSLSGALSEWTGGKIEVAEVSEILTKAMLGENEQLKQLGIAIRKDTEEFRDLVKQLQEAEGYTKAQAEAMATLELIQKKSADAQASFNQEGNKLLRWWRNAKRVFREMKENLVEYFSVNAADKLRQERTEMNNLFEAAMKTADGTEERKKAIELINTKYGKYLDNLLEEKAAQEDIRDAMMQANDQLIRNIALKEQENIVNQYREQQAKEIKGLLKKAPEGTEDFVSSQVGRIFKEYQNLFVAEEQRTGEDVTKMKEFLKKESENLEIDYFQLYNFMKQYNEIQQERNEELRKSSRVNAAILGIDPEELNFFEQFETKKTPPPGGDGGDGGGDGGDGGDEGPDYEQMLTDLEEFNQERTLLIKEQYAQEKLTREEYQRELYKQEMSYLIAKKELHEKMGEDTFDIDMEILEKQVKAQEKYEDWMGEDIADKTRYEETDNAIITRMEETLSAELAIIDKEIHAHEKKSDKIKKIEQQTTDETLDEYGKRVGNAQQMGAAIGDVIGEQIAKGEMDLKNFGKTILLVGLKTMRGILQQAIFEGSVKALASKGFPAGLIEAGILTGLMTAAFAVLEAKIQGQFAEGRYPVIGPDDGKKYNAQYVGVPKTGIYSEPSFGLFSEKEPEMVIDGPTTRNLQVNYPGVIDAIMAARQFATGQYNIPAQSTEVRQIEQPQQVNKEMKTLMAVLARLDNTLNKGVEAKFGYKTVRDIRSRTQDIERIEHSVGG